MKYLIVPTLLETKKFDKQIEEEEKKLQELSKEKMEAELKVVVNDTEIDNLNKKITDLRKKQRELANLDIGGKEYDVTYRKIEEDIDNAKTELKQFKNQTEELLKAEQKITKEYDKQSLKLDNLKGKKQQLIEKQQIKDLKEIRNSTSKVIKSVGKWALAIFSVRGAYSLITGALNALSSENEQLGADIENIRYGLASSLLPIIQTIVGWVYKLMQYVNAITKAWFGKEIFSKKNVDNIKNANKEANKMTASFDEMQTVSSSSQDDSGGGINTSGFSMPDAEVPKWLQWIIDNKDLIIGAFVGIGSAIEGIKIADLLGKFGLLGEDISKFDKLIKGLGIGLILTGIYVTIKGIIDYLNDPSWENFGTIIIGIGIILGGLALVFGGIPLAIAAAITLAIGIIAKFWDKIEEFGNNIVDGFNNIEKTLEEKLGLFGVFLNGFVDIPKQVVKSILDIFGGLLKGVKQILDGIIKIFKGDFKGGLESIAKGIANILIGILNGLIGGLNAVISPIRALIVAVGKVMGKSWTMDNISIPRIPKLAKGGIINLPGRGIPVGGYQAIGGERGQEGVIPLTDSQQMALLGESIGKYVNINLTNITQLDGRTIARKNEQINANRNFAMNR